MKPRPRVNKYLDRGLKKTLVEGLIKPRSRSVNLGRGLDKTSVEVVFFAFAEIRLPKSVTQVHGFTLDLPLLRIFLEFLVMGVMVLIVY